jgi:geranylgeranyl diphosphate synthase type II
LNLQKYLSRNKKYIETALDKIIIKETEYPDTLYKAVRYSIFAGGKRIRPILMIAAAQAVGGKKEDVLYPACAVEMIHTYSLIHDDLPAMDNDNLRRGKPTCHRVYGNAAAILAGDALLTEAFAVLTNKRFTKNKKPALVMDVINDISTAAGYRGMIAGQMVDMELQGGDIDFAKLEFLHIHKTGALICACVKAGAKIGGASPKRLKQLVRYGERIGLAFQIVDDILDITGEKDLTGKESGQDKKLGKITYPKVVGIRESKNIANELLSSALDSIKSFDKNADALREIARYIIKRNK